MDSIINVEDRLRVIKAIFELSNEAKVLPDDIYIYTIYQKWEPSSNFRSESLALSIDDPRHKKTIEIIYDLSTEIIALFDQLKKFIGEIGAEYKYKIDCKPRGGGLGLLYLVRWKWESESRDEFQFIEGEWWPYRGINNEDNSDFIYTNPLFLIDFVFQVHQFLKDRILVSTNPIPDITKNVDGKYILKNESVILKLFEEYGSFFPDETKDTWKQRWINGNRDLPKIKVEDFKVGNNKHLIFTILHQAHILNLMDVDKIEEYTKKRWGLKSYHSVISKFFNARDAVPHPEEKNIKEILKLV